MEKMPHSVRYSVCIATPGISALGQSQKQRIKIGWTKSVAGDSGIMSRAFYDKDTVERCRQHAVEAGESG